MVDLVLQAELVDRRDRVAAAHHRDGGGRRDRLRDLQGALGEGLELEHAHRSVPDDIFGVRDLFLAQRQGFRSDVHGHLAGGHGPAVHRLGPGVFLELVRHHVVDRQDHVHALRFRLVEKIPGRRQKLVFHQRLPDFDPLRLQEGVGHAAPDDEGRGLGQERIQDGDFRRHLGPADDGHERFFRIGEQVSEELHFLLDQESGRGRQEMRQPLGGGVRPVRGTEGVVDVHVAHDRKLLGEARVVGRLFLVEAHVFEHQHVAGLEGLGHRLGLRPDAIRRHFHGLLQKLGQPVRRDLQAELRRRTALGPAQVAHEHERGARLLQDIRDGRQGLADARVVGDFSVLHRHVEIDAHEHALVPEVHVLDCFNRHDRALFVKPVFPGDRRRGSNNPTRCRTRKRPSRTPCRFSW